MAGITTEQERPAEQNTSARPERAYELTDEHGHQAIARWRPEGWRVEAGNPSFRRRVQRALRKPLWTREDAVWPDGVRSSYHVQLQPTDPRYPNALRWKWFQIGLEDVSVRVISL